MARMRASWFVFARVPAAWLTRASFRSSTVALAAVLVSTSPARAQVADPTGVVQLGPHLDWAGIESTAPHDLRWNERLPESRPEPTAGDIRGDLPRSRMADLADQAGELRWREHVTLYAKENLEEARGEFLRPRPACDRPEIRLTVDELPDYFMAQEVARNLDDLDFDISALISQAESISSTPALL